MFVLSILLTIGSNWFDFAFLQYLLLNSLHELLFVSGSQAVQPSIPNLSFPLFEDEVPLRVDISHFLFVAHVEWLDDVAEIAHLFFNVLLRAFLLLLDLRKSCKRVLFELPIELLVVVLLFRVQPAFGS